MKSRFITPVQNQNEMIQLLGFNVQKQMVMELKEAGPYALTADETMDISRKEQLSICVIRGGTSIFQVVGLRYSKVAHEARGENF